jgi:hypothetical protein
MVALIDDVVLGVFLEVRFGMVCLHLSCRHQAAQHSNGLQHDTAGAAEKWASMHVFLQFIIYEL